MAYSIRIHPKNGLVRLSLFLNQDLHCGDSSFTCVLVINKFTIRYQLLRARLQQEQTRNSVSKFHANDDFMFSYEQIILQNSSQECQSFITLKNVFNLTKVYKARTMLSFTFNRFKNKSPSRLKKGQMLLWVYDVLFQDANVDDFLCRIRLFL